MESSGDLCRSFSFSATADAEVLILGSMPGTRSLQAAQYYAHPHNLFWEIIADLCCVGRERPYDERLQRLREHRIALWDVARECRRHGSLDGNIRPASVVPNDFQALFARAPDIHSVFFNGHAAEQLFLRLVAQTLSAAQSQRLTFARLPSTSPAHATLPRAQKKELWQRAITLALQRDYAHNATPTFLAAARKGLSSVASAADSRSARCR